MKVAVHGSYFSDNFGDTLLVKLACDYVANIIGRDKVFLAVKGNVSEQKKIGYPIVAASNIKDIDLLVFAGGGYFGEPPLSRLKILKWSIRAYLRHFFLLRKFQDTKILILGVGIGPLTNKFLKMRVRQLLARSDTILVRDSESSAYIQQNICNTIDSQTCVDFALSLRPGIRQSRSGIAIHLPGLSYLELRTVVDALTISNFNTQRIIFISDNSHHSHQKNVNDTKNIFEKYYNKNPNIKFFLEHYSGPDELINTLDSVEFVLTSKLHVGIVTVARGGKAIAIPLHTKTIRLYKQLSIEKFLIRRSDLNVESLATMIKKIDDFLPNHELIASGIKKMELTLKKFLIED